MKDDRRTAIIVVIAIIVAAVVLSVLAGAWWSSCSKWDIEAPDLRVSASVLMSTQERESARYTPLPRGSGVMERQY